MCNITFFFSTCVLQNMKKLSFFLGQFFANFLDFQQNTVNIGISAHFSEQTFTKNGIFGSYYLVQVGSYYLVQVGCVFKNANLDQIITSNFFARNIFQKKSAETPIFIVFLAICVLEKTNLDQIITSKRAKLGPDNNFTAYIYIYTCMCVCMYVCVLHVRTQGNVCVCVCACACAFTCVVVDL